MGNHVEFLEECLEKIKDGTLYIYAHPINNSFFNSEKFSDFLLEAKEKNIEIKILATEGAILPERAVPDKVIPKRPIFQSKLSILILKGIKYNQYYLLYFVGERFAYHLKEARGIAKKYMKSIESYLDEA